MHIIILTGLCRVGKTSLMKLIIYELIRDNIEPNHILYISLDDYLLHKNTIVEIVNKFRQLHKIKIEEKNFLLFDEITYKEDFHVKLKNINIGLFTKYR